MAARGSEPDEWGASGGQRQLRGRRHTPSGAHRHNQAGHNQAAAGEHVAARHGRRAGAMQLQAGARQGCCAAARACERRRAAAEEFNTLARLARLRGLHTERLTVQRRAAHPPPAGPHGGPGGGAGRLARHTGQTTDRQMGGRAARPGPAASGPASAPHPTSSASFQGSRRPIATRRALGPRPVPRTDSAARGRGAAPKRAPHVRQRNTWKRSRAKGAAAGGEQRAASAGRPLHARLSLWGQPLVPAPG